MRQKIDTDARRDSMVREYRENNKTTTEIGEMYGVTRERVRQILKETGVIVARKEELNRQRATRRLMAAEARQQFQALVSDAIDLVRNGSSIRQAAMAVGLKSETVAKACKRAGVKSKHGRWRDFTRAEELAKPLVEAGMTAPYIVSHLKVNGEMVSANWVYDHFGDMMHGTKSGRAANDNVPSQSIVAA